jgi:hypothetical protein
MTTSSLAADRTPTVVRLPPRIAVRAPPERSRTVVRLVLSVWLRVAAPPPDDSRLAALPPPRSPALPPELPCWLPELPWFWLAPELPCCFAPIPEPDWEPESCACATFMLPIAGSAATGAATAKAAAAPKITASIRIFFS